MSESRSDLATGRAERRREQLRRLLEERAEPRRYPVSLQQERIWVAHQLDPDDPSQNVRTALEIRGDVERSLLAGCIDHLVARHEQLRARFPARDGRPETVVSAQLSLEPERLEPPSGAASDLDESTLAVLARAASRPFDLESGPVARWAVLELDPDRLVVLLVVHHIACDAWSMDVLVRDLVHLIEAARRDQGASLPALEASYGEFVAAERRWLKSPAPARAERFWSERLRGLVSRSILPEGLGVPPSDRPERRRARRSRRLAFELESGPTRRLAELTRRRGVSLHMVLLTAFAALLHRATGAADLVVSTPVANRSEEEWESLVGYFVNLLPLRIDCSASGDFGSLLTAVRREALAGHEHRQLPTHRIAEAGGLRQEPLLELLFQHGGGTAAPPAIEGLTVRTHGLDVGSARTGLALSTYLGDAGIAGTLEHDTSRIDAETARRLLEDLRAVLVRIGEDDAIALTDLPVRTSWRPAADRPIDGGSEARASVASSRGAGDQVATAAGTDEPPDANLPTTEPVGAPHHGSQVSPGTAQERLTAIWRQVLSLDDVSPFDNFLDVGGDSLAALQVIERIEASLDVRLTPAELFTQTLAQLATLCERRRE